MAKKSNTSTKSSETEKVDAYMKRLKHPLSDVVETLRQIILQASPEIGEEIKWNAPTFFYTGELEAFDPKEYKRYLVVSNLHKKDCIRLVFWRGSRVKDHSGLLEGDYDDGRRLATFSSVKEVKDRKKVLQSIVKEQIKHLED